MKILLKVITIFSLTLFVCILVAMPVAAQVLKAIQVTDQAEVKEKISDPSFSYSDDKCYTDQYIEVISPGPPRKSVWVHYSQIKSAAFESAKDHIRISVALDSGEVLRGVFPDSKMKISGKGELGDVTYDDIGKIKCIEFLNFSTWKEGKNYIISRQEASSEWGKRKKESGTWTIVDGNATVDTKGFAIRDCKTEIMPYSYVRKGMFYVQAQYRKADMSEIITVQRGVSKVKLSKDDVGSFEITGRKIDDKPELIVERKDGNKFTVTLLIDSLDEDDTLVWQTPYGWEGISLLPPRKIMLKPSKVESIKSELKVLKPELKVLQPELKVLQPELKVLQPQLKVLQPELKVLQPELKVLQPELKVLQPELKVLQPQLKVLQPEQNVVKPQTESIIKVKSTITFENRSGQLALVKIEGPVRQVVEVTNSESKTVNVSGGRYFIKIRYGDNPEAYTQRKGEEFDVEETTQTYSQNFITLHPVVGGTYKTFPISAEEFNKD